MARGNDPNAESEFQERHKVAPNAQKLIKEHRESFDSRLLAAQRKQIDFAATEKLDLSSFSGPNGEEAQSAVVRGGIVIFVYEDEETNSLQKGVAEVPGRAARAKNSDEKAQATTGQKDQTPTQKEKAGDK